MRINELQQSAANLEASAGDAMATLRLSPEEYAWFTGTVHSPMAPQEIIPDSAYQRSVIARTIMPPVLHDTYSSSVTHYGGRAVNDTGRFSSGHINAHINEAIPEGAKHNNGAGSLPVPYVARILELHNGVLSVDTPTTSPAMTDGPLVIERTVGADNTTISERFRNTTKYNTTTGDLTIVRGELITDGWGMTYDDKRTQQDASDLPPETLELRIATLLRTIGAATLILEGIAASNSDVAVSLKQNIR